MNTLFFIQILLESLPISSSGHVFLFSSLFSLAPLSTFENFAAHIPTFFIVICIFLNLFIKTYKIHTLRRIINDIGVVCFATAMTACSFVITRIYPQIISFIPTWYGFLITSLCLLVIGKVDKREDIREYLTWKDGLWLGLIQSISLIPGVSRFAATLVCGILLGLDYRYSLLVSAALQIVICAGGFGLSFLYVLYKGGSVITVFSLSDLIICILVSCISYILLYVSVQMYLKEQFWKLGFYMFLPAFIIFVYKDQFWESCATIMSNVLSENGVQWL